MINHEKIGIGIITFNRERTLQKLCSSLDSCVNIDAIVIINDGAPLEKSFTHLNVIKNEINLGVGKSKNKAFRHLLNEECEHIFLIEDDIYIKNSSVFEKYIAAAKITGIQHFNYSQHGTANKTSDGLNAPNSRFIVDYKTTEIALYPHCVGAFSYYSKRCLDNVGLMDERYYNAWEHVDHTLEIIKGGYHPAFWYFADIPLSWEYLGDEEWSLSTSTISSNPNHAQVVNDANKIFLEKHGFIPGYGQKPLPTMAEVLKSLEVIREIHGWRP